MKLVVLDGYALNPGDLSWEELKKLVDVTVHDRTPADLVVERARDAEMVLTNKTPVSRVAMEQLPKLRYIGVLATGYNIVDVAAATDRGITVTNVPTYGTMSVAQYVFALLLELCHRVQTHSDLVRAGEWSRSPDWSFWRSPLIELAGKTLGVVGFGRIGRQVARIGDAMGMRIAANDCFEQNTPPYEGFQWLPLEELLDTADVVSLHCPLTPENTGLLDSRRLALLKPSAFVINTARGPLIVDADLADALNAGRLAGAALDVLSVEPPAETNPLLKARNCIVTPHIAWATHAARARLLGAVVGNIGAFLKGTPVNTVNA